MATKELWDSFVCLMPSSKRSSSTPAKGPFSLTLYTVSPERLKFSVTKIVSITGEAPGDRLARALATKPKFGLFCTGKLIGARGADDPTAQLEKVWQLDGLPREWCDETVLSAVAQQTELKEVSVVRRQPRGAKKSFWLKAKSPPELDCHPIWFINDAADAEQVWVRIAPPRTVVRTSTAIKEKSTSFPVSTAAFVR